MTPEASRLVVIAGPSCVGKTPLHAALGRLYPELSQRLRRLVLYNSRAPRPGEKEGLDYHFRPRAEIEALRERPKFTVMEVRGDLQAVDEEELSRGLQESDALFEGNPFVGAALLDFAAQAGVPVRSVFISPLSHEELQAFTTAGVSLPEVITEIMRRKLLRRTVRQKGVPSATDLEEVERRARSAYRELQLAPRFDYVLPNHDGEDSENWNAFSLPVGEARRTLLALVELLEGGTPAQAERWTPELVP